VTDGRLVGAFLAPMLLAHKPDDFSGSQTYNFEQEDDTMPLAATVRLEARISTDLRHAMPVGYRTMRVLYT
jgi:hypothetical protein